MIKFWKFFKWLKTEINYSTKKREKVFEKMREKVFQRYFKGEQQTKWMSQYCELMLLLKVFKFEHTEYKQDNEARSKDAW